VNVTALDLPRQPEVVARVLPTCSEWGQVLQSYITVQSQPPRTIACRALMLDCKT